MAGSILQWSRNASGVLCVIVAYLDMLEGDENVVYWDDVPVLTRKVEAGEKTRTCSFIWTKRCSPRSA
jgi:hypothetical protein